jgi:hypothetical protein
MPRYFFNLAPGLPADKEGEELPDDAAAMEVARQTVVEIVRDGPPTVPGERLVVSNEEGETVVEVYLEENAPDAPEEGSK